MNFSELAATPQAPALASLLPGNLTSVLRLPLAQAQAHQHSPQLVWRSSLSVAEVALGSTRGKRVMRRVAQGWWLLALACACTRPPRDQVAFSYVGPWSGPLELRLRNASSICQLYVVYRFRAVPDLR